MSRHGRFNLTMDEHELDSLYLRAMAQQAQPQWDPMRRVLKVGDTEITEEFLYRLINSGGNFTNGTAGTGYSTPYGANPTYDPSWRTKWQEDAARERAERAERVEAERRAQEAKRERQRREDEARRKRYEQAREEQARRERASYDQAYENLRDFFTQNRYAGGGFVPPRGGRPAPPPQKSDKEKLADLAGVEWETAKNIDTKALLRKAMRNCHPDTGGSHEKWIELEKLKSKMKL
jgi:hypothetical protein